MVGLGGVVMTVAEAELISLIHFMSDSLGASYCLSSIPLYFYHYDRYILCSHNGQSDAMYDSECLDHRYISHMMLYKCLNKNP